MEYNFKDIYQTFTISYFSKNHYMDKFVDFNDLNDYESVEKYNNDKISIFIKKFKLKFSFIKTLDFSEEFIISDYYNFNSNDLYYTDSLIKIAIITDDLEKWLKSDNLENYDCIFTLEEYIKEFDKYKNTFIIKKDTVYKQITFIFNELYRRKLNKFYLFINKHNFQNVFPKWKNYFNVLNSEFFDESWYRKEYNIADNTDSIIHFLLVGSEKNYDPSPNFSNYEYYECNPDIKEKGVNPLIHYEIYGKKENRIIRISDMIKRNRNCISNSCYFDNEWYRRTYDISDDVDCVDHYLNIGYLKGFNPGPDFSTYEYWECNLDVKKDEFNPLLHYELYGKNENVVMRFSKEQYQEKYSCIANSSYFDLEWYRSTYDIDGDCVNHYLNIGYTRGFNPGPDFSTYEYYKCNEDVKEYGMNPLLHYELYGKHESRMLWISDMIKRD